MNDNLYTMANIRGIMLGRTIPFLVLIVSTYLVPWAKRTYLITGLSGKNFHQTDVSNCQVIYPQKLVGCEDLHVYDGPDGPMVFTGCFEKITDTFVRPSLWPRFAQSSGILRGWRLMRGRLGSRESRRGIRRKSAPTRVPFIFMSPPKTPLQN